MAPVVPGMTDSPESIESVARAASEHGASTFAALPLRLAPLVKDHFFGFLADDRPDLLVWYSRNYRSDHAPQDFQHRIAHLSEQAVARYGLNHRTSRGRTSSPDQAARRPLMPAQLSLF
jgi:hypothetical protein